jgi:hypothetical protein
MGFSFHGTGRLKRTEECWSQSRTIDDRSPRFAAKTKENAAGMNSRPNKDTRSHELRHNT